MTSTGKRSGESWESHPMSPSPCSSAVSTSTARDSTCSCVGSAMLPGGTWLWSARGFETSTAWRGSSAVSAWRERVHLVGERHGRRLQESVCAADLFALMSRWEGLPMALLEALSLATPAVVSPAVERAHRRRCGGRRLGCRRRGSRAAAASAAGRRKGRAPGTRLRGPGALEAVRLGLSGGTVRERVRAGRNQTIGLTNLGFHGESPAV